MAEKKIRAIMIVEIAGKPAEYVKESLDTHTAQLEKIPGIEIVSRTISEPKKLENQDAYTSFSEIDIKTENFQQLLDIVFDFMPSSIEIIEPGAIEMDSQEATMFINNFAGRLHRYDDIAKIAQFKIRQLTEELNRIKLSQQIKIIPKTEIKKEEAPKKISKKTKSKKSKA